jgi:uncharacterized surface protein with fasciclin (FAS1) repeats
MFKRLSAMIGLLVLLIAPASAFIEVEDAQVQLMHLSPDAPAVDVFIDGELALEGLPFPQLTGFLNLPPGTRNFALSATGDSIDEAVIGPVDVDLVPGNQYLIAAIGSLENGTFGPVVIDATAEVAAANIPEGRYPLLMLNAYDDPNVPAVDIANGRLIVSENLGFGEIDVFAIEAGVLEADITATGTGEEISTQPTLALPAFEIRALFQAPDGSGLITSARGDILGNTLTVLEFFNEQAFSDVGTFNTLLAALEITGLAEALDSDDPLRLYAPTDAAFDELPEGTVEDLLEKPDELREVLEYHVLPGEPVTVSGEGPFVFETLQGADMSITLADGEFRINDEAGRVTAFMTTNGLLSVIDAVLTIPEE